jgi:DNA-binding SARP family transcriptional activator
VILITAEAGYGKTTLLADFSRHTRRRVLWYRVDENDRSWVSFVRYLVAAAAEVDPAFGTATLAILDRLGKPDGPSRDEIVAALIGEYQALGSGSGAILILDDYHQVDDVPEIRAVLNEFVGRAPDRLTIVIAGRRTPGLALARLRSIGAVAELQTDDLRFDLAESDRLFRETYGRALDRDLLADLARRTDGWAACLQLVQAALRNRPPLAVREFISGLSGATGDLHDYLAEEVVGDLRPATQQFLMRISLLQSVYPQLAAVVGETDDLEASRLVAEAERDGLLSRRSEAHTGGRRYHPLVQEFLEARLRRDHGEIEIVRLHRLIARHAESTDWRLAAHHFAAAGDIDELHRLVEASVPSIMAGGDFAIAESFIDRLPDGRTWPIFDIVLSRMELARDQPDAAVHLAESAVAAQRTVAPSALLDQALTNLMSVYFQSGRIREAILAATELLESGGSGPLVAIARATTEVLSASVDGPLGPPLGLLRDMAALHQASGDLHYFGITQINIGDVERAMGRMDASRTAAESAIVALTASSQSYEVSAARLLRAWALAHANEMDDALAEIDLALNTRYELVRDEARLEAVTILLAYGDPEKARVVLSTVGPLEKMPPDLRDQYPTVLAELEIQSGRLDSARAMLEGIDLEKPHRDSAFKVRVLTLRALGAVLARAPDAKVHARAAVGQARSQGAGYAGLRAEIIMGALDGEERLDAVLRRTGDQVAPFVSTLAELFVSDVVHDSPLVRAIVEKEVLARPQRWRQALRAALRTGNRTSQSRAGALLDVAGEPVDVPRLRAFSKQSKAAAVGRGLARRVAEEVRVADLGRVTVTVGQRIVDGNVIRRKVLALLCFLITRPNLAAARDQVVDALWPDQDPGAASNSLNQTVYFLRRVFEPTYVDDLSPGYLRHDSDLIWLDSGLVVADSEMCRRAIDEARKSLTWAAVDLVSKQYRGRFALDFEYEEWAANYRDHLHASYLEVIERAVRDDTQAARFDRAIEVCRRALDVDPSCEPIERQLLHLYKVTGSHAAAEEQYRHYAAVMRDDLGVTAPPLSEL